ncbi:MAG TPA: hypothetical protein VHX86_07110 [Tepidisphaeraceae bacterium]|jgi:hypothetical protein|nr:hypothetical protein [Tepidisphaeraceae bacterium]
MSTRVERIADITRRGALPVGIASVLLCILIGIWPSERAPFFNAYLFGWLFWLAISLGGMALTMLHCLTGGGWGVLIRPITTSAARALPLLMLLFLPIFLGLTILFPWARPAQVAHDPILLHAHAYLNPAAFAVRFVIYFLVWIGLMLGLTRVTNEGLLRRISAGGLVIYVILMTLAGVDWIMSRQAHWSSSVFGFIVVIAQSLTALCFTIVILWSRADRSPIVDFAKPKHYVDLANMLLMFLILWAYMNFAQYLITWTGNEQPDVGWYVQRTYGGWRVVAGIIIFIHFLVPFFLLLMRPLKKDIHRLGMICAALLALRVLDLYWNVGPQAQEDPHGGFILSPLDILAWLGIGGIWYAVFSYFLAKAPPLALPRENPGSSYGTEQPQSA